MRRRCAGMLIVALCGWVFGAAAGWGATVSVLDQLTVKANATLRQTSDGVEISTKSGFEGIASTKDIFKSPVVITAVVKTDVNNLRLHFSRGIVTLNSSANDTDLRIEDPRTHAGTSFAGMGAFPSDTWFTVKWTIDESSTSVSVNGEARGVLKGDYSGLRSTVGIGTTSHKGVLLVRSLTVTTNDEKKPGTPRAAVDGGGDFGSVDVVVPTVPPKIKGKKPSSAEANVDVDAVERPAYRTKTRELVKSLCTVTGMGVQISPDGDEHGFTTDIIGTVMAESRGGSVAGAGISVSVGPEMQTCFKEAVRAIEMRYPFWEPGHIDVTFGEKYIGHEGGSAGTAFSVLMLSMLEDFDVDPKFAVTGDITVDWKVRTVGGITAKLRGAALDGCKAAAIPEGNEPAFADMRLLYGDASMWNVQVFSIGTLQEAVGLLRMDRDPKISESMKLFDGLRPDLAKADRETLASSATVATLNKILELTPNCLSAKYLLEMAQGKAPRVISSSATIYNVVRILYPFKKLLTSGQEIDHTSLSLVTMASVRKQINALRPLAPAELVPLLNDAMAYAEAINNVAYNGGTAEGINAKAEIFNSRLAAISSEEGFMDKLVREGY